MTLLFFLLSDVLLTLFQQKSFDLKSFHLITIDSLIAGIKQFPFYSIVIFCLLFFAFFITKYLLKKINMHSDVLKKKHSFLLSLLTLLALFIVPSSFSFFTNKLIAYQVYKAYLKNNIQLPKIDLNVTKGKNLLLIYLESFETEYTEKNYFPHLTPYLQKLKERSVSFEKNYMIEGSNFSLGGMFTSQCGAPLQYRNTKNLICLGDILHKANYRQVFMQGSDMTFEHMGEYYLTHGYDELYGKKNLPPINEENVNDWGTTDEDLFTYAYTKFSELNKNYINTKQPYNLTLFTSDTHNGQPSRSCPKYTGLFEENNFFQSYYCTDYLVNNFISKILNQPGSENLVVALIGDHLQHFDVYASRLNKMDRRVFSMIYTPKEKTTEITVKTNHTHFTPTLLPLMDIKTNAKFLFGSNILDGKYKETNKLQQTTLTEKKLYQIINSNTWLESIGSPVKHNNSKKKRIKDLYSWITTMKNISKEEIKKYFLPEIEHYKNISTSDTKAYYSIDDNMLFIQTNKFFNDIHLKFTTKNNYFFDGNISASKAIELANNWYVWIFGITKQKSGVNDISIKIHEVDKEQVFRDKVIIKKNNDFIDFIVKLKNKNVKMAFYIYRGKKRVDTQWYSNHFYYKLDTKKFGKGKYRIRYFVVDKNSKNPAKAIKTEGFSEVVEIK